MLRAVMVVGLMLVLLVGAVFGPRLLKTDAPELGASEAKPHCDLDQSDCAWSTDSGDWRVSLAAPKASEQIQEYQLRVESPAPQERLLAVLRGLSMYMGEYPVSLRQQPDGSYLASFQAPLCSAGSDMRWRLDLQSGQAVVGSAPFTMGFRGHAL